MLMYIIFTGLHAVEVILLLEIIGMLADDKKQ